MIPWRTVDACDLRRALRTPECGQEARCTQSTRTRSNTEARPTPQILQRGDVAINAPLPRTEGSDDDRHDRECEHVFVALAGVEDEEPISEVVGDQRHQHDTDDAGGTDGSEQSQKKKHCRADLGQAGDPSVEDAWTHAERFEQPPRAFDLASPEDVADAMRKEDDREQNAGDQQRQVHRGRAQVSKECVHQLGTIAENSPALSAGQAPVPEVASEIAALGAGELQRFRIIVAGGCLGVVGILLVVATHWGGFG